MVDLTIGIPTFNREDRLIDLINFLLCEINKNDFIKVFIRLFDIQYGWIQSMTKMEFFLILKEKKNSFFNLFTL